MRRGIFLLAFIGLVFTGTVSAQETEGETQAEVTIVKYSDYQCPACKYFFTIEQQLEEEFGDKIEIVSKHFPLNMHQHAQLASRAVEAARAQGKYKEMHEMVFTGQEQWARGDAQSIFIGYAKSLDLDQEQFREDLNSAEMQRRIMSDKSEGRRLGVNSTPTFFINGQEIENNPRTFQAFKSLVESYME